jgi:hypothetical protein
MKRKKLMIIAAAAVVLIGVVITFVYAVPPSAKKVPHLLQTALVADGRYEFSCMVETGGEGREYFWLSGEKNGDSRHVSGRVLGSELDLYYLDGYIYRYDVADQSWYCYDTEDLGQAAELYVELEPASAFAYDSLLAIEYIGHDRVLGRLGYEFLVTPQASGWIGEYFTDVTFTVCLDRWGGLLSAEVEGTLKDDANTTMTAFVVFQSDGDIEIEAP